MRRTLAVVVAVMLFGGCSLAGRTFGTFVDDASLTGAVKMNLARKDPRNLTRVKVDTFEQTVYLTGQVPTALQKSDAEIAAWEVEGVTQVVNDLRVRDERVISASPAMTPATPPASPIRDRLPGIARVDPPLPGGGALAYDATGALVATVYARPMREVAQSGFDPAIATDRPIDHVTVYGVATEPDLPEAQIYIVFWHVSRAAAAALR
jgi:hypothetical protein